MFDGVTDRQTLKSYIFAFDDADSRINTVTVGLLCACVCVNVCLTHFACSQAVPSHDKMGFKPTVLSAWHSADYYTAPVCVGACACVTPTQTLAHFSRKMCHLLFKNKRRLCCSLFHKSASLTWSTALNTAGACFAIRHAKIHFERPEF